MSRRGRHPRAYLLLDQVAEGARLDPAGLLERRHVGGLETDHAPEPVGHETSVVNEAVDGAGVDPQLSCRLVGAEPNGCTRAFVGVTIIRCHISDARTFSYSLHHVRQAFRSRSPPSVMVATVGAD